MNHSILRTVLAAAVLALFVALGWWLIRDASEAGRNPRGQDQTANPPPRLIDTPDLSPKGAARPTKKRDGSLLEELLSIPNERIVRFSDEEAYRKFLSRLAGSNLRLLGRLDRLRALRIGYDELADLEDLLGDENAERNYYVAIPILPDPEAQPGAVGFGRFTLEWLGITGDNSNWGAGVKIAVLDTGIGPHSAFLNSIREIDLVTGDEPVPLNGHGTAVASLIASAHPFSPGIAPAAEIVSVRVADESGVSNSFLLAEGILAAVDEGAQLINVSMGSLGNSALVREAVEYAIANDVLIIASAGNQGLVEPAYPAGYDGVVAVGAIDGNGDYLNFSNRGVDLDAPGFSVNAAWPGEAFIQFSGTSASAPLVTGATGAVMSEFGLSAQDAYKLVVANLNEAGVAGTDPLYGDGNLNVGRTIASNQAGIYDAAAASTYYLAPTSQDPTGKVVVVVENRGTELLTNTQVAVTIPGGTFPHTIPSLRPGEFQSVEIPLSAQPGATGLEVSSRVSLSGSRSDSNPQNDALSAPIVLPPSTAPAP